MRYTPPTPEDIETLKRDLEMDGNQMARLFGVADRRAFRRYTSKSTDQKNKREVSAYMLFFAAAQLELSSADFERVLERMRAIGATIEIGAGESS